jgi:hypothetical protein
MVSRNVIRWEYVSGLVLWAIWKARCIKVFQGVAEAPAETIKVIWSELLHTLRGQWDSMQGTSARLINIRSCFRKVWDTIGFYSIHNGLKWNYVTPSYLFYPSHQG